MSNSLVSGQAQTICQGYQQTALADEEFLKLPRGSMVHPYCS